MRLRYEDSSFCAEQPRSYFQTMLIVIYSSKEVSGF